MTRFLDSLAGTLAGLVLGVLLVAAIAPGAWELSTPRSARVEPAHLPAGLILGRSGQPDGHPGARRPAKGPGRITPSSATGMRPAPTEAPETALTLSGIATWYRSPAGVSAAGPDLRAALGSGWRGTTVQVCHADRCTVTVLGDWMRADRLVDLDDDAFRALAPLSVGVLAVTLTPIPAPPVTSTRETP